MLATKIAKTVDNDMQRLCEDPNVKDTPAFQAVAKRFRSSLKIIQSHLMENKKKREELSGKLGWFSS